MQYQTPQFIEIEDKIFGPFTFKQFIYLVGGGGACVALWLVLPSKILAILFIIPIAVFSLALALYRVNNKPFIDVVQAAFYYFFGSKLYIWKKEEKKMQQKVQGQKNIAAAPLPKISESRLKELSWSLDIKENVEPLTGKQGR